MDERGELIGENLLGAVELAAFPFIHLVNLLQRQEGEHTDAFEHIGIAHVSPVLVEVIGRGLVRVKPDGAGLGLAHLLAFGIEKKSDGHGLGLGILFLQTQLFADELTAGQHVGPLIVSAELQVAAVLLVENIEVIGLHDHVVELKEAEALFHALLVALGTQHVVDGEVGTHLPQEFHIVQVKEPVGIVDHDGLVIGKVDKTAHLNLEAVNVVLDDLFCHHGAHIRPPGGVTHHARSSAQKSDRLVAGLLQALHQAQGHKVAHMEAVGGRVKPDVEGGLPVVDQVSYFCLIGNLGDQASGAEFFKNSHCVDTSSFLLFLQFILFRSGKLFGCRSKSGGSDVVPAEKAGDFFFSALFIESGDPGKGAAGGL